MVFGRPQPSELGELTLQISSVHAELVPRHHLPYTMHHLPWDVPFVVNQICGLLYFYIM